MEQLTVKGNAGELGATFFPKAKEGISKTLLIAPATGTPQRFYKRFATYLSEQGLNVYTFDYSGIGASRHGGIKDCDSSLTSWAQEDLGAMIAYIKEKHPADKLILMGQSLGGQLVGLSAHSQQVDGLVFIACQSGYWNLWPFPLNLGLYLNWAFLTLLTRLVGYFPGKSLGIMENLPKHAALEWAKWGRAKNYMRDFFEEKELFFANLHIPLLSYSFTDDTSAPLESVEWLLAQYSHCEVIHKRVAPTDLGLKKIGHFGFFRTQCKALWEEVYAELLHW